MHLQISCWALTSNINFVMSRLWGLCSKKLLGLFGHFEVCSYLPTAFKWDRPREADFQKLLGFVGFMRTFPQQRKFSQCFSLNSHSSELQNCWTSQGNSAVPQPAINFLGCKFFHTWDASHISKSRMGSSRCLGAQEGSGPPSCCSAGPNQQPNKSSSASMLLVILNFMGHSRGFGLVNFNIRKNELFESENVENWFGF